MTPDQKRKLEEMADKWRLENVSFTPDGPDYERAFIDGSKAGIVIERERCAAAVRSWGRDCGVSIASISHEILNPKEGGGE